MKPMSIRDVVGPIMVGPSSSHTAGALRIASMVRNLLDGEPVEVTFTLFGSFAHTYHGHGTDRALVAGMLGLHTDDLRVRNSFDLAKEQGLEFSFEPDTVTKTAHPNTVEPVWSTATATKWWHVAFPLAVVRRSSRASTASMCISRANSTA